MEQTPRQCQTGRENKRPLSADQEDMTRGKIDLDLLSQNFSLTDRDPMAVSC